MRLNGKLITGLAWAGLALVLVVPSADIISAQFTPGSSGLKMTSSTDAVQTASIGTDPVTALTQSGTPLPSYISDAPKDTLPAAAPVPTTPLAVTLPTLPKTAAPTAPETDVAIVEPVAPEPYPASMRPHPAPPTTISVADPVVVLDDTEVAAVSPTPTPRASVPKAPVVAPDYVTEEDLADWDSGTLADYLASRGLLDDQAIVTNSTAGYDSDGFYLDEGPNGLDTRTTIRSRSRYDDEDGYFMGSSDRG